uniref:Thyroglobulin type-1 domain-containing protein n=1 Tax=Cyprinus carpio TaxID=7962 RepID=A0A8C2PQA1_CYPCA
MCKSFCRRSLSRASLKDTLLYSFQGFSKHCHICLGYLWQWRQACVLDCARGRHQAVCGSNGRMYKSLCSFQRAQCINRQLRTAAVSTCTGELHHRKQRLLNRDALRSKCQLARSQALQASTRSDSFAVFIPECKADGTYTEVQCHNQTGYCWCSSPDGIPVSGSSVLHLRPNCTGESCLRAQSTRDAINRGPYSGFSKPLDSERLRLHRSVLKTVFVLFFYSADSLKTCEHEQMSMLAEEAIQGPEERFVPECSADGRYRAVQCHRSTGYCWCVRVDSGRPVPGTSASIRKAEFLTSLIQAFRQEVESGASYSHLRLYFTLLDADADGLLNEREARSLRLLLRRTLRPRRCAKKFMQFCDRNADRRLSAEELTSCLGI